MGNALMEREIFEPVSILGMGGTDPARHPDDVRFDTCTQPSGDEVVFDVIEGRPEEVLRAPVRASRLLRLLRWVRRRAPCHQ